MKYLSFREYGLKCDRRGIRVEEECICCGKTLLMCKRYGGQCKSSKCREDRYIDERPKKNSKVIKFNPTHME